MITINKKGWHYNLVKFGTDKEYDISNNLCIYFWQCVRGFLLAVLAAVMVVAAVGGLIFTLSAPFMSLLTGEAIVAFILCVMYGVFFYKVTIENISTEHWLATDVFAKFRSKEKERKPSIIKEYLKAKKQKICPTLTFE